MLGSQASLGGISTLRSMVWGETLACGPIVVYRSKILRKIDKLCMFICLCVRLFNKNIENQGWVQDLARFPPLDLTWEFPPIIKSRTFLSNIACVWSGSHPGVKYWIPQPYATLVYIGKATTKFWQDSDIRSEVLDENLTHGPVWSTPLKLSER
jgi:hypothetical protein